MGFKNRQLLIILPLSLAIIPCTRLYILVSFYFLYLRFPFFLQMQRFDLKPLTLPGSGDSVLLNQGPVKRLVLVIV